MHFPTGVLLIAEVEKVKESRLKDEQCLEELKSAKNLRVKFSQETSVVVTDAKISVASRESFVKLRAIKASLEAKASDDFRVHHSQEIDNTFQPLALLLTHMEVATMRLVNSTFDIVLGTFTEYVGNRSEEGTVMFDEAKDAHCGVFPNVKQMYKGLIDEPGQKSLETKYEGLKEIVADTATAFRLLSGRSTFDVKNPSLARIVQDLTSTDEANGRVNGMVNFTRLSEKSRNKPRKFYGAAFRNWFRLLC